MPKWFTSNTLTYDDIMSILSELALVEIQCFAQHDRFSTLRETDRFWQQKNKLKEQFGEIRMMDRHVVQGDCTYRHTGKLRNAAIAMAGAIMTSDDHIEIMDTIITVAGRFQTFGRTPEDDELMQAKVWKPLRAYAEIHAKEHELI